MNYVFRIIITWNSLARGPSLLVVLCRKAHFVIGRISCVYEGCDNFRDHGPVRDSGRHPINSPNTTNRQFGVQHDFSRTGTKWVRVYYWSDFFSKNILLLQFFRMNEVFSSTYLTSSKKFSTTPFWVCIIVKQMWTHGGNCKGLRLQPFSTLFEKRKELFTGVGKLKRDLTSFSIF